MPRRGEAYFQAFAGPAHPDRRAARCCRWTRRARRVPPGAAIDHLAASSTSPRSARFAATADPAAYPPEATYIRDADAKPQDEVPRRPERSCRMMMRSWMAPLGLHIEPAQPRDAEAVAKLHAQSFYRGWPRQDIDAYLLDPDTPTLVACDSKRTVAGFAMLRLARRRRRAHDHRGRAEMPRQGRRRGADAAPASTIC